MNFDYDLIVLGSGGGAFAGAIRARESSRRVLMVEHGTIGGTCVNVGCIPSKTLLADSARARRVGGPSLAEALARKAALVASAWAPYLAMAEGLKLAAQTFDRDVAELSCCAA